MGTKHSEATKAKIANGQKSPKVVAAKKRAALRYWRDVRAGRKPPPKSAHKGRPPKPMEQRFWDKVNKCGPLHPKLGRCWEFVTAKRCKGYKMLSVKSGEYLAHRISWTLHNGPIPDGVKVLHHCDNRGCVNPSHLFLGSLQDNMDDMVSKGRSMKGSKSPTSKLTEVKVKEIRRLYATGKHTQQELADSFGVNQTNIGFIIRRRSWTHV